MTSEAKSQRLAKEQACAARRLASLPSSTDGGTTNDDDDDPSAVADAYNEEYYCLFGDPKLMGPAGKW